MKKVITVEEVMEICREALEEKGYGNRKIFRSISIF